MTTPETKPDDEREALLDKLHRDIEEGQFENIDDLLSEIAPADIADALEELAAEEKGEVFQRLDREVAGEVLIKMSLESLKDVVAEDLDSVTDAVETMEPDETADLLDAVGDEAAESILSELPPSEAATAQRLLAYRADTAGGIMTTDFVLLARSITAAEAVKITQRSRESETITNLFVADEDNRLVGHLPLHHLVFARPDRKLEQLMETDMETVPPETDQEEVVRLASRYDLDLVPVTNRQGVLLGVITSDDILEAAQEEVDEDMYVLAGTAEIDPLHSSVRRSTLLRLPWLILSLLDGLFIAFLSSHFQSALEFAYVALFIPLIPLMGGNVAVQSSTIVVRALAVGDLSRRSIMGFVTRQASVILALALSCGTIAGVLATTMVGGSTEFMLVVGMSVTLSIMVAGSLGIGVPLAFDRIGIDPAVSAGPFGTMLNDALCIVIYLSLATTLHASP